MQHLESRAAAQPRCDHLNASRAAADLFPGYFGKQGLTTRESDASASGELVIEVSEMLYEQVRCCLRYREQFPAPDARAANARNAIGEAAEIVAEFFDRFPAVREMLATDVQAAFDGDPAAQSTDETIFCYPGLFAIFVQRMAHEFYHAKVPLLPRIMTEYAHSLTGIDIHPGAELGRGFFHRSRHRRGHRRDHRDRQQRQDLSGRDAGRCAGVRPDCCAGRNAIRRSRTT